MIAQPWPECEIAAYAQNIAAIVDVAVVEQHERRLAAELEEHPLHGGARGRHDLAADRRRAGERHDVDVGMRRQLGADRVVGRREHVHDAGRDVGRLGDELAERERRPRRVGRALEHDGAAGRERGRELRERELDRVVVRGDRADDAGRLLLDPAVVRDPRTCRARRGPRRTRSRSSRSAYQPHDVDRAFELRAARARHRRADLAHEDLAQRARRCRAAPGAAGAGSAPGTRGRATSRVVSNARRAAAIARRASSTVASAATPSTSSVAGSTVSYVAPPAAGTSSPSISSRSSCQIVTLHAPPGARRSWPVRRIGRTITLGENRSLAKSMRDSRSEGGRMDADRAAGRRSPTSAPSSTRGSTRTHDELAPPYAAAGHARRADRADAAREGDPVRRGLDALRLARARSAGSAARRCCAPSSAPRSPRATSPIPGLFSLIEVLAPTLIDFAPPDARGRGRPAPALGRGDVVPGLLGARHRQRPRVAALPRGARRRRRRPRRRG